MQALLPRKDFEKQHQNLSWVRVVLVVSIVPIQLF
ncbi:hypothetical protein F383_29421 [Gossypium arboreum]|uniref:Uncharacterized protein n=1 Tax=Gossypium arboreum TaxID=29729 RepID=A0A0B0MQB1_GOSAR|nr:hypothetical protein F383_29421 [Gossypium arboreum]